MPALPLMPVTDGVEDTVPLQYQGGFSYLSLSGEDFGAVSKELMLQETLEAPVEPGMRAGVLRYELNGKVLGEVEIVADGAVRKAGFLDYFNKGKAAWLMQIREESMQPSS